MSGARQNGTRAIAFALTVAFAPSAAIVWVGCGDDDAAPSASLGKPDPGGTWGAQLAVTVVGRGRVTGGGLDCPDSFATSNGCFASIVFPNNAADGATGGITLTAAPDPGRRFVGWSFEPVSLGGSGRGPDRCNPVTRAAAVPGVDTNALAITLPYGEVDGAPPTGREAECAAYRKVPVAYKVVASFETDERPDAGSDAAGDGGDGDTVIYDIKSGAGPVVLGRTSSGYLYWTQAGAANLALWVGLSPESLAPQFGTQISDILELGKFKVEPTGVVLYDSSGRLQVVRQATPTVLTTVDENAATSAGSACLNVAMDASSNVYCRTVTSIATWKFSGGVYSPTPTITFVDLPPASAIAVDTASIYYTSSTQIFSVPLDGTDASAPTTVISGTSNAAHLVASTSRLAWNTTSDLNVSDDKLAGASANTLGLGSFVASGIFAISFDPFDPNRVFAAGPNGIYYWNSAGPPETFRGGKTYSGMAVGGQYVLYSILGENKIYRARKPGF